MDSYSSEHLRSIAVRALDMDATHRYAFVVSACCNDPDAVRSVLECIRTLQSVRSMESTETVDANSDYYGSSGNHRFMPGQIIDDRLRIIHFINEGGMGEVYAALELNLQEMVALKAIRSDIAEHSGSIERFKTEVKQSLRITHPNVCRVHQLASHQDRDGRTVWFLT